MTEPRMVTTTRTQTEVDPENPNRIRLIIDIESHVMTPEEVASSEEQDRRAMAAFEADEADGDDMERQLLDAARRLMKDGWALTIRATDPSGRIVTEADVVPERATS